MTQVCRYNMAQCRLHGLAIFNVKNYEHNFRQNIRKQFYQTALGNCYDLELPKC